ncbi:hypothetical protein Bca4012_005112 [Brassica carinata]|uniref:Uncharacterized protein n=3 Tax=Brassica TaxID=3705 RepID=A0A0D3BE13_BRAOL|nr:uncharacterized protein LOC125583722 [Brassica napus]KAG2293789.1 hypothetical protein Bca52824_040458 [Brassica carinata]CAF1706388.1 unnamed protein product [Brassica napus]CDY71045.1 BnaUnng04170D [Brassica napus]
MDNKSATAAEADPSVIEATTHLEEVNREPKDVLEKHKKDMAEKKISDVMEILQGVADRLQKMEEKMDSRLQKMEEKVDLLISSFSVKAEADNMSIDQFSFGQESGERYSNDRFGRFSDGPGQEPYNRFLFGPGPGQETYDGFGRVFDGRGRGQETDDRFGCFFDGPGRGQETDDRFGRFFNGRGRALNVGGRLRGGRCGGQGYCGAC